jgi:hypothetical protein
MLQRKADVPLSLHGRWRVLAAAEMVIRLGLEHDRLSRHTI